MKNLLENAIQEVFTGLVAREPSFCGCPQCREDVLAYALNKLRPRYTTGGDLGVALAKLDLGTDGARATIAVTLMEGIRRVGGNPHRTAPGRA